MVNYVYYIDINIINNANTFVQLKYVTQSPKVFKKYVVGLI